MPQSRQHQTPPSTTGTAEVATDTLQAEQNTEGNGFIADLLAGRARLDGDAQTWFARGVQLQVGMRGSVVAELQALIGASPDGVFGRGTESALKAWQTQNGRAADGTVDAADWSALKAAPKRTVKPQGEAAFDKMWESHPHNYLPDSSQNTASGDLNKQLGFEEGQFANTCALRMSTMLNRMGGDFKITREKAEAAGLGKMREGGLYLPRAKNDKDGAKTDMVIVSAKEMWTYMEHQFGKPDQVWPPRGRNLKRADAEKAAAEAQAAVAGKKGFIAFDNLQLQDENGEYQGYAGSGHVDIFDGGQLSDGEFYPCQRISVWYVVK